MSAQPARLSAATAASVAPVTSLPQRRSEETPQHLHSVSATPRKKPSRVVLVSAVLVGVFLGLLGIQLALSIVISSGAYEARALKTEERDLLRVERVLSQNMDKLSSPQNLAANAAQLGMVENLHPATLRLSDGAILGSLETATSEVRANNVPNATLSALTPVDAAGLSADQKPAKSQAAATSAPVRWKGKLPAPATH
ncbi:hypothetical protein ICM05_12035 [Leucobacter sp. cx-42]|uniref:hypothetical protein n=1 Tax=unclassified Leucobacter TaxID=2621730 RepID=UPI00165DC525|nr:MULTISPECIES: hypothetical protein [unclassified Leucobacter]MBC9955352.1 hypothetical protein [Leucobacter sp. cx-42]